MQIMAFEYILMRGVGDAQSHCSGFDLPISCLHTIGVDDVADET